MNKPLAHKISYSEHSVKIVRDLDRRFYRNRVIGLVVFQLAIAGPVRIAMDTLASHQVFAWIKPGIMPSIIGVVVLIWVFGILHVFGRRA